jgi:hypothetical protein
MAALRYLPRVLVALVIFFASGEILARALDVVDRLNGYNRLLYTRGPSHDLPYLLRPGLETVLYGVPVRVNRLGLRERDIEVAPGSAVHRILMLGDSVLFGTVLPADERVSDRLQRALDAVRPGGWEVVNAGVPGFNTVAEARWLARRGIALRPSTVVVAFSLNDYEETPHMSPIGVLSRGDPRHGGGLLERSEFALLLRWGLAYRRGTLWHQFVAKAEEGLENPAPQADAAAAKLDRWVMDRHLAFYRNPDPPTLGRLRGALREIHDLTVVAGIRLVVAVFPESYQVGVPRPDLTPQRVVLAECAAAGIACLDLQPAFAAAGGTLFSDMQHPNGRGHEVATAELRRVLLAGCASDPRSCTPSPDAG